MEAWLTKKELAAELRVSVRTVERLHLPAMRVGRQNRYLLSQVEQALSGAQDSEVDNVFPLRSRHPDTVA